MPEPTVDARSLDLPASNIPGSTEPQSAQHTLDDDPPAELPVAIGSVFLGKYRIEKILGQGGMGVVMAAHHQALDQRVAIKFMLVKNLRASMQQQALARFQREARAAAKLQNEHIARVLDVGVVGDAIAYMIMEYLEGCDLSVLLHRERRLPVATAVDYVLEALDGLAEAHAKGIVHRDLKPSNLFLAKQGAVTRVKVLDFGIAKSDGLHDTNSITTGDSIMGTPRYMSPEQMKSTKNVDRRSDIWSMGVILYELLAGDTPFQGETTGAIFAAVLQNVPRSLREIRSDVPAALDHAVLRCLAHRPDARFGSAAELARAIAPFASPRSRMLIEQLSAPLAETGDHAPPAGGASSELSDPGKFDELALELDGVETAKLPGRKVAAAPVGTMLAAPRAVSAAAAPRPETGAAWSVAEPTRGPSRMGFLIAGAAIVVLLGGAAVVRIAMSTRTTPETTAASTTPSAAPAVETSEPAPATTAVVESSASVEPPKAVAEPTKPKSPIKAALPSHPAIAPAKPTETAVAPPPATAAPPAVTTPPAATAPKKDIFEGRE